MTGLPDPDQGGLAVAVDVAGFAAAVSDVIAEAAAVHTRRGAAGVQAVLVRRLTDPEITAVLAATPAGTEATVDGLLREAGGQPPGDGYRLAMVGTLLLSQVDTAWWGSTEPYLHDADVLSAGELTGLTDPRRQGRLRFRYRMQPRYLPVRLARAAQRRVLPGIRPHVAGLRFDRSRPEMIGLLNDVAREFAARAPAGTPPLWVTSLARSVAHQLRLRALGYPAMLPSAHCVGYAADLEMAWYRRFGADRALASVLLDRRATGELNVIDEGQVWHVCLNPDAAARRLADGTGIGG